MPLPQARRSTCWQLIAGFFLAWAIWSAQAAANGLASEDMVRLKQAVELADRENWRAFARKTEEIEHPLAKRYLRWRDLLVSDREADWQEIVAFAERNAHWPDIGRLQAAAERQFDASVDFATRREFFENRRPLTKEGKLALAEALLETNDTDKARDIIRQAWINDDFGTSEIRKIEALFGQFLRPSDHVARLDRLLWDGQWTSARRMFSHIDNGHQALADARIRLQRFRGGVDRAIRAVPNALIRDPGLTFDRLHWRRRKGKSDGVLEILLDPPEELGRDQAWWYERKRQIHAALDDRKFFDAARLAKAHQQTGGLAFAEANWLAGWLSLRFLDEPKTAYARFERIYEAVRSPISRGRAAYWTGRAAAAAGDDTTAQTWYRQAMQYPTSFYGQEAAAELGKTLSLEQAPLPVASFSGRWQELAELTQWLCAIDEADSAVPFLRHLTLEPDLAAPTMALAVGCERPDILVELAKYGVRAGVAEHSWSFPVIVEIERKIEPALLPTVLAVSRQESHFDAQARSGAGAEGLMQLMPGTARAVGRREGIRFERRDVGRDPILNMRLGSGYLQSLSQRYDGDLALMAAAYNAGPGRVAQWIERHGDPRRMSRHERLDWIELIPFSETRNYVQRVIEGHNTYASLLGSDSAIRVGLHEPKGKLWPPVTPKPNPRR